MTTLRTFSLMGVLNTTNRAILESSYDLDIPEAAVLGMIERQNAPVTYREPTIAEMDQDRRNLEVLAQAHFTDAALELRLAKRAKGFGLMKDKTVEDVTNRKRQIAYYVAEARQRNREGVARRREAAIVTAELFRLMSAECAIRAALSERECA